MTESKGAIGIVVDDMFFAAKIRGTAQANGEIVTSVNSLAQIDGELAASPPSILLVDLNSKRVDPFEVIERVKSTAELAKVPVIGFLSHVEVEMKRRAEEAGFDYVLPRSLFSRLLPEIVTGNLASLPARA
ncbi:MAG TPA: response regulator [Blastocatellia bacterium]|nr:response regulator [Blastocatellia bacterium]